MSRSAIINVMMNSVFKVSRIIRRDFSELERLQVSSRGSSKFTENSIAKSKEVLHEELIKARPNWGIKMKGYSDYKKESDHIFYANALCGINNFSRGIGYFAITVALEINGHINSAVVYDPIKNEVYVAEKGKGAFLNDIRMRVSKKLNIKDALLAFNLSSKEEEHTSTVNYKNYIGDNTNIRSFGCEALDLANVAAGRYDCYITKEAPKYDTIAGILLVRESGGLVYDFNKEGALIKGEGLIASPASLTKDILALCKK